MNAESNDGRAVLSVLPKLPNKPVVITDNAKYHSRQTEGSRAPKQQPFDAKDTKPILLGKQMFLKN